MNEPRRDNRSQALKNISTEKLEILIRQAPLEDNFDAVYLDALMYEYCARTEAPEVDVGAAWQRFQSISEDRELTELVLSNQEAPMQNKAHERITRHTDKKRHFRNKFVQGFVGYAAVIAILLTTTVVAAIAVPAFRNTLAKWTSDVFSFNNSDADGNHAHGDDVKPGVFSSLQEALTANNVSEKLAPTWFPDGFKLQSVDVSTTDSWSLYFAAYSNLNDDFILILLEDCYNGEFSMRYEKTDNEVREFYHNNIRFFIFDNINTKVVAWLNGHFECSISFPAYITDETIISVVKSI